MPLIFQKMIYREDLQNNPSVHYVFGDNMKRVGIGGQAAQMRYEPNAIGIATKRAPGSNESDYFYDGELDAIDEIKTMFLHLCELIVSNGIVVFPSDGIGSGLARLETGAPALFQAIKSATEALRRSQPHRIERDIEEIFERLKQVKS